MALTQEAILNTLLEGRGKVKNSELLSKFKDRLNCSDPAEKKHNRDLFKTFVNNVGVVKEFQDTKYIVLKKVYHHLLEASNNENAQKEDHGGSHPEEDEKSPRRSSSDDTAALSPIEVALERCKDVDLRPKKSLHFTVPLKSDLVCSDDKHGAAKTNKPFALPLRMPQTDIGQHHKKKLSATDSMRTSTARTPQRHFKPPKPADEPKYHSHRCPLDPAEHEWMVKSAAGQWNQVYGLLLKDAQLAEKKDFMSGFTALHWAAKCGNTDMVCRIIDQSRKSGNGVDVDAKSNGGYTPLHIAAIHNHVPLIDLLVQKYCANGNLRDNCGKKPYHYLRKGVPGRLRELLGDPRAVRQEVQQVREDCDPHRYPKSRLFPTHPVGIKKKNKGRIQFISVGEDERAERDEPVSHKQRLVSDVFP